MSNRSNSLGRFLIFGLSVAGGIILFLAVMGIAVSFFPILIGALAGVAILIGLCWGGSMLLNEIFQGHNPAYQRWKREGDPWWDTLPPPFRAPRHNAPFRCMKCKGPMQTSNGVCPSCNFGANEMVCSCGTEVTQPTHGAFETTGVICPNCRSLLYRGLSKTYHKLDDTLPVDI